MRFPCDTLIEQYRYPNVTIPVSFPIPPLYQPANKLPDKESALTIKVYMFYCQPIINIYCQAI